MAEVWVLDASPLIVLAKAGLAHLLEELSESVEVPRVVLQEIEAGPDDDPAIQLIRSGFARIVAVDQIHDEIMEWGLGAGETAALSLARRFPEFIAVIDDATARRCAQSLGIRHISTVSIIVRAHFLGRIDSVRTALDALRQAGFWLSDSLHQALCEQYDDETRS